MKLKSLLLIVSFSLLTASLFAQAPAPTLPPTTTSLEPTAAPKGVLDAFQSFFSEPDTQLGTFSGKTFSVSLGACFENNINADAALRLNYVAYKKIEIESITRIWNSTQTIKSQQIGIGIGLPLGDLKISAFLTGGWRFEESKAFAGAALELDKGVSKSMYIGTRVETDIIGKKQVPYIALFTGRTF